jgi:hypothetical protein
MFTDTDLDRAVDAGALSADAADGLRAFLATRAAQAPAGAVDEEQFRLITGFNDIFVTIAIALVIFASAALGGPIVGAALVAGACWAMAEFFTRRRRMALPSIVLLLGFAGGLAVFGYFLCQALLTSQQVVHSYVDLNHQTQHWTTTEYQPWQHALMFAAAGLAATLGAVAHWRRFRVAITIAAGVGAAIMLLLSLLAAALGTSPATEQVLSPAALFCGLGTFALAMRWDLSDPRRQTVRADVAFWLHLAAAPLIVHPLFFWIGALGPGSDRLLTALGVLAIYLVFAVVALAVDRRALLVSALAYVLGAMGTLMRQAGAVELGFTFTALLIGLALLTLSAWWAPIRARVLAALPPHLAARLPGAGPTPQSA